MQQPAHSGNRASLGHLPVVHGVGVCAAGLKVFILGIEQVKQGPLPNLELATIGLARLLDGKLVLVQVAKLFTQTADIVIGDGQCLADVATALVAQVLRFIETLGVLAFQGAVRSAIEEVVVEDQFDDAVRTAAIDTVEISHYALAGTQIDARLESGVGPLRLGLRRTDVLDSGVKGRTALIGQHQGIGDRGRKAVGIERRGDKVFGRQLAHHALIARTHIMEIAGLGEQVRLRQRQATGCLLEVNPATHSSTHPLLDLVEDLLVLDVVFLDERNEVAIALHILICAIRLERRALGAIEQFVVARQLGVAEFFNFGARREAVIQHLVERQRPTAPGVVRVRHIGNLTVLAPNAGGKVHSRIEAATRHALFLDGSPERVPKSLHLGVGANGPRHRFLHIDGWLCVRQLRLRHHWREPSAHQGDQQRFGEGHFSSPRLIGR